MGTAVNVVLALALLLPALAVADGILRGPNGTELTFHDGACRSEKVLRHIPKELHPGFKTAGVLWEGKRYTACWASPPNMPEAVVIVDELGETGLIPRDAITFDAGV